MQTGFILLDPDFRVARVNAESLRVDGRSSASIIGGRCWDIWPGLEDTELGRLVRLSMAERVPQTLSHRFTGAEGQEARLEMRVHPWGEGLAVFFRDVTDRWMAKLALEVVQERYLLAARATNDVIWDWDVVANDIRWNEAAAEFLGADVGSLHTSIEWWEAHVHPEDREAVVQSLQDALDHGSNYWSHEYRFLRAGGDYATIYDRGFIVRNDNGEAIRAVGALVDLTDRRMAEQKVQQLQSELIHVSRLSAMGTMASTLAHELNQPLTAVSSYVAGCERLADAATEEEMARLKYGLKEARTNALRAGDVIRRLRAMIERGEVEKRSVNLAEVVEETLELMLMGVTPAGLVCETDIAPDLMVEADAIQLQQVLLNLTRNAAEAMEEAERKELLISAVDHGTHVTIEVHDTGSGIPAEMQDALFEPFISTKEKGMGIGLSISRTIVEAHRGRIWADPNERGGTTFRISLPSGGVGPLLTALDT